MNIPDENFKEQHAANSRKIIFDLINQRVRSLESLHRHLTMLSATLLGILAVFGTGVSESRLFAWAIVLGSIALFLSLLSGTYCLWQYYKALDKAVKVQTGNYLQYGHTRIEFVQFSKIYGFAATFCPAIFLHRGSLFIGCSIITVLFLLILPPSCTPAVSIFCADWGLGQKEKPLKINDFQRNSSV